MNKKSFTYIALTNLILFFGIIGIAYTINVLYKAIVLHEFVQVAPLLGGILEWLLLSVLEKHYEVED